MNATVNSINGQMGDFTHLTADEIEMLEAYRLGRKILAKQATEATEAAPAGEPVETPVTGQESEHAALYEQFKQLTPIERKELLNDLWKETAKQEAEAVPPELPDYVIAQIVVPLVVSLITHVLDPMDLYRQKYSFGDLVDWMADVLPAALTECDTVPLMAFLEKS